MSYQLIRLNSLPKYPFTKNDIKGVGRYTKEINHMEYICDVVFEDNNDSKWTNEEIYEYNFNNNGFHKLWTYDLNCMEMKKIVMDWINELPYNERNKKSTIRHIMYHMSSENSGINGLIVGKWDGDYSITGKPPSYWNNSKSIFKERFNKNEPVKYGQCWCFAECFTTICRFLKIPCRTIGGENVLIDENLDNGVDFKEDLRKGKETTTFFLLKKESIVKYLTNIALGENDKGEIWEEIKAYETGDSYWNFHYWNEVKIDDNWEIVDTTPLYKTVSNDIYNGMKMLGPCNVKNLQKTDILSSLNDNIDFDRFITIVNSPFRLWTIETIVENNELINIPFIYSIVYPFSQKMSVYIETEKIKKLFKFKPQITTRLSGTDRTTNLDITDSYISNEVLLKKIYYRNINLEGRFYIQLVYLDIMGNVIKTLRFYSTFDEMKERQKNEEVFNCYIISYLLINIDNVESKVDNSKWITFCHYYQR